MNFFAQIGFHFQIFNIDGGNWFFLCFDRKFRAGDDLKLIPDFLYAGQVTLSGEVPTEIDKDLAGSLAKEMPGVKEVRNQLQIVPNPKLVVEAEEKPIPAINIENLEMEANLREKIQAVAELKDQPIKIKVQNREVTLTGHVAIEAQKIKAEQIIHDAPKVTIVHNQIRVGN